MKLISRYFDNKDIREFILSTILLLYVVCAYPLIIVSYFWYKSINSNDIYILIAVAISANLLFIFKKRINVSLNSFLVSMITFFLGVAVFWSNGFNSVATILFLTASIISAINIGRLAGVLFHISSILVISIIIYLSHVKLHRFFSHSSEIYSLFLMLIILVNYSVIAFALVVMVGHLYNKTKQKIDTDLVEAKKELENQLNLYHSFLNSLPGIFYVMTIDEGKLVKWNNQLSTVTGYTHRELKELQFKTILKGNKISQFHDITEKIMDKGIAEVEQELLTKEGKLFPYYFSNGLAQINGTNYITGIGLDISRRKVAEEQLRHTQKMETIGVLAGGIAHDFNNILGAIIGYTELALFNISSEKDISVYLEGILKASERAKGLIHQILIFSRKVSDEISSIDLITIFKEFSIFFRSSISTAIDLKFHHEEGSLYVKADPTHIHQILLNLGVNAQYAVKDKSDGIISISITCINIDKADEFKVPKAGQYAHIKVADNGIGIPEKRVKQIFDPFFSTKPQGESSGMGLSVVHGIVKDYNGSIEVKSKEGEGTLFNVYLPLLKDQNITPSDKPLSFSSNLKMGNGERIMIIDDDEPLLMATSELIRMLGFEPVAFNSSTEAYEELLNNWDNYLLVVSDHIMPMFKGLDIIKNIRRKGILIPFILTSGYSDSLSRESALTAGATAFYHKPVDMNVLADEIKKHI